MSLPSHTADDPVYRPFLRAFSVGESALDFDVHGVPFQGYGLDDEFSVAYEDEITPVMGTFAGWDTELYPASGGWKTALHNLGIACNGPGVFRDHPQGVAGVCALMEEDAYRYLVARFAYRAMIDSGFVVTPTVLTAASNYRGVLQMDIEGWWPFYGQLFHDNTGLTGPYCIYYKNSLERSLGHSVSHADCKQYFDDDCEYFWRWLTGLAWSINKRHKVGLYSWGAFGGPDALWNDYYAPTVIPYRDAIKEHHRDWCDKNIFTCLMPSLYSYYRCRANGDPDTSHGSHMVDEFVAGRRKMCEETAALKAEYGLEVIAEACGNMDNPSVPFAGLALSEYDVDALCQLSYIAGADKIAWWQVISFSSGGVLNTYTAAILNNYVGGSSYTSGQVLTGPQAALLNAAFVDQHNKTFENAASKQLLSDFQRTPL